MKWEQQSRHFGQDKAMKKHCLEQHWLSQLGDHLLVLARRSLFALVDVLLLLGVEASGEIGMTTWTVAPSYEAVRRLRLRVVGVAVSSMLD